MGISRISHMFRLSGLLVLPRVSRTSLSMRNGNSCRLPSAHLILSSQPRRKITRDTGQPAQATRTHTRLHAVLVQLHTSTHDGTPPASGAGAL